MKINIKRKAALFLTFVLMLSIMTGCGGNDTKAENSVQKVTESTSSQVKEDIKIAALKGPTAIGMVELMKNSKENAAANNYEFQVAAAADEFTADLIKGNVQLAAVPCNVASTLYNKSQGKIQVLGINTLGVLYIVDTGNSVASVADLKGKTIYMTGKGTTPEYTLRYLLKMSGIDPDKDVTIEFKSEASEVAAVIAANKDSDGIIAMLPQPYVTTVMMNNDKVRIALDVTKEWEKSAGKDSTVVTGVVVVNTEYYKNHKAAVDKFVLEYQASVNYVNNNVDSAAALVEEFGIFKAAVAKKAIPYCNITFVNGSEMKTKIGNYLKVLYDENPNAIGGAIPDSGFYVE